MKPTPITSFTATYAESVRQRLAKMSTPAGNGCREWTGTIDKSGYGKFHVKHGGLTRMTGAHRAAWLAFKGEIPAGLVVDHLCRNRRCVNVAHMEVVTNQVNCTRGDHSTKGRKRTGCAKHGYEDGYTFMRKDGYEAWTCRTCAKARQYKYRANLRAA